MHRINIEIFGLEGNEAVELESRIFELFRGEECVKDMVITIHNTTVRNVQRINRPFIRFAYAPEIPIMGILEKLTSLDIDIEPLSLGCFLEAESMAVS